MPLGSLLSGDATVALAPRGVGGDLQEFLP